MTTHRKPPTNAARAWDWTQHYSPLILVGYLAVDGLVWLLDSRPMAVAALPVMLAALFAYVVHTDADGCDRCIAAQSAATGEDADTHTWWLQARHLIRRYLAVYLGVFAALAVGPWFVLGGVAGAAMHVLAAVYIGVMFLADWHHQRFQSVCPWCRDEPGPGWPVVDPDPAPSMTKDRA